MNTTTALSPILASGTEAAFAPPRARGGGATTPGGALDGAALGYPDVARLLHELWVDAEEKDMLVLAGPMGDDARRLLKEPARLVWTVWAESHFEVMTKYYEFRGRGEYETNQEWDHEPYPEEWLRVQRSRSPLRIVLPRSEEPEPHE